MVGLSDIAPAFLFVIDKGLIPSGGDYMPQQFGNAVLVMAGMPFSLKFERDRGQVFISLGSDAIGWYKLEYIVEFIDGAITQQQLGEPPDTTFMAIFLQRNWDKIGTLFLDQLTIHKVGEFCKQKSTALLARLFGRR